MKLLEDVGRELQARYTYADLDLFFAASGIPTDNVNWSDGGNSKRNYAKAVLAKAPQHDLLRVADELGIAINGMPMRGFNPPANWQDEKLFRLFISHVSSRKDVATKLKLALQPYAISGFVAHEDIHPTLPWMDEVERALQCMDALLAVHTQGFSLSNWTQQEIGFALGKGVKVISFKWGEDPTGFIGKHQALARGKRNAEQIAIEIDRLLRADDRTIARLSEAQLVAREREIAALQKSGADFPEGRKGRTDVSPGTLVRHGRFGEGLITGIDGNKLDIRFVEGGSRRVLDSFVEVIRA